MSLSFQGYGDNGFVLGQQDLWHLLRRRCLWCTKSQLVTSVHQTLQNNVYVD